MSADIFIFEGRSYSWRALCDLRRAQLEARREARGTQPLLFVLHEDSRPPSQRTAAGRFAEPCLLDFSRKPPPG